MFKYFFTHAYRYTIFEIFEKEMLRVNYLGSVFCTKAVVDSMKRRRFGRIAFTSSQGGQLGIFGFTGYSPTKFALRGLAESLQMELTPYNVYVTVSYPPDTDTPGFKTENLDKVSHLVGNVRHLSFNFNYNLIFV